MSRLRPLAGAACALLLLIFPETALNSSRQAMYTWATGVAPALFPFMLVMPLLTCRESAAVYERMLGRLTRRVLKLPGAAAPAVVTGMIAGSPAGAHAAVRVAAASGLTTAQLERIVCCAGGLSPAFLVSGVGAAMLGSAADGRILMISQIIAQTALLLLTRWQNPGGETVSTIIEETREEGVSAAVGRTLGVCGYMMAFNIAAAIFDRLGIAAGAVLDLPTGAAMVANLSLNRTRKLLILSAMTGFGGVCIVVQNLSAVKKWGVRPKNYLAARAAAAAIMPAVTALQLGFIPPEGRNLPRMMPFSALTAVFLIVPVWIFLANNAFLNKRNFERPPEIPPENGKKPHDAVVLNGNNHNILKFKKV